MKYKHKKTGIKASRYSSNAYSIEGGSLIQAVIVENSSDWEKIEENIWRIISAKTGNGNIHISAVSNGKETFSIGDYVTVASRYGNSTGEIGKFESIHSDLFVEIIHNGRRLLDEDSTMIKKPILYTTEDGVKRYEWQKEWWIYNNRLSGHIWKFCENGSMNCLMREFWIYNLSQGRENKIFSTKEAAEKWMEEENNKTTTMEEEKKIRGYKAPIDLYSGFIKAGTVYMPVSSGTITIYAAVDSDGKPIDSGRTNLPKEIVEKWEPIYSDTIREVTVGVDLAGNFTRVKVRKGSVEVRGTIIPIPEIIEIERHFSKFLRLAGKWDVKLAGEIRCIHIGCDSEANRFSLDDLNKVIAAHEVLTDKQV